MKHPKIVFLVLLFSFSLSACVKVLSKRSDDQAWLEFDQDLRQNARGPASQSTSSQAANDFLQDALALIPVRNILLKCGSLSTAEACYRAAILLQFDEVFRQTQAAHAELRNSDYRKLQSEYLTSRAHAQVYSEVQHFHQSILSGMDLKAREHATDLFHGCENEKGHDVPIENFGVFAGTISEMPKGVYACLTKNWNSDQDQLLIETSDRLGITIVTTEAKQWIKREQIVLVYEAELNELTRKKSKEELERFTEEKSDVLRDFNPKLPEEALLKEWTAPLRERFPYSPVEQWVSAYRKERVAQK